MEVNFDNKDEVQALINKLSSEGRSQDAVDLRYAHTIHVLRKTVNLNELSYVIEQALRIAFIEMVQAHEIVDIPISISSTFMMALSMSTIEAFRKAYSFASVEFYDVFKANFLMMLQEKSEDLASLYRTQGFDADEYIKSKRKDA